MSIVESIATLLQGVTLTEAEAARIAELASIRVH